MKDGYRVGFEIVHKSDDLTKMVGIFVFKVNHDKYYAPVFFINGNVKGNILLYRVTQKAFVPATNDWCEYLVGLSAGPEGSGVPISDRRTMRNQMNLIDIVEPPLYRGTNLRKYAGFKTNDDTSGGDTPEGLSTWLHSIQDAQESEGSILRDFIEQDGGFSAIQKIANTVQAGDEGFEFAENLFRTCNANSYMPQLEVREKVAAAREPLLVWHSGLLKNANVRTLTEADIARGYVIEDHRKEAHLNEAVFEAHSRDLESVTEPGVYNVLLADGGEHEMLCGYYEKLGVADEQYRNEEYGITSVPSDHLLTSRKQSRQLVLIDTTNDYSRKVCPGKNLNSEGIPMGHLVKDITSDIGKAKPEKGKAYRIYNAKNKSFSEPFWVTEVKDGTLTEVSCTDSSYDQRPGSAIYLNPDYEDYDKVDRVYGKHCVFVEIADEESKYQSPGATVKRKRFCEDIPFGEQSPYTSLVFAVRLTLIKSRFPLRNPRQFGNHLRVPRSLLLQSQFS